MAVKEGFYGVGGVECRLIWDDGGDRVPVLFLHGYSFTGSTWKEIGVLDYLSSRGNPWAAPDMPYGRKTDCTKHTRDVELNVEAARRVVDRVFGSRKPVVVGASLGGKIALYYAVRYRVAGLMLLAPAVRLSDNIWSNLSLIDAPVTIIAGSRDRIVPLSALRELAEKLDANLVVYEGAGHAMYLEEPDRFKTDLNSFLLKIEGEPAIR